MTARGFTLVEALAALAVLSIVAIGILPAFTMQLEANTRNEIRSGAVGATQMTMEALRATDPAGMRVSGQDPPQNFVIGSREFTVITHYCLRPEFCGDNSRHLFVEVYLDGRKIYDVESVHTRLL